MHIEGLQAVAHQLRLDIIQMLYKAQSGHPGGSLSAVEIMTTLYFHEMNINPEEPNGEGRDRFILSKGHASPVLYTTLAERGYFNKELLYTFRQLDSRLQGHPDMKKTPGVDFSSGSLGQGLSVACGMAMGSHMKDMHNRIYVLLGDGELNEGQVWEGAMFASKMKLNHIVAILDYNKVQLDGTTDDIMPMEPMVDKWIAFGWHVIEVDGHDIEALIGAFAEARLCEDKPTIIIAHTIKGKGISYMENKFQWHGKPIQPEDYMKAMEELSLSKEGMS